MAALFPDQFFHIGGDEVNGKEWDANPKIQAFKQAHGLKDNNDLQAYFNQRVQKIVSQARQNHAGLGRNSSSRSAEEHRDSVVARARLSGGGGRSRVIEGCFRPAITLTSCGRRSAITRPSR